GYAVFPWSLADEVSRGRCLRRDLRPDAGEPRHQRAVLEAGIVPADRIVEERRARLIEGVVDAGNPLDVRTETRLPPDVERQVGAEPARNRNRKDERAEGTASGHAQVV